MKEKKIKYGEKYGLFSDTQYISSSCPGAGNYNPHVKLYYLKEILKKMKN